ncbi:polysaccharide lyase [Leptospira meyeri]|uniref:polysaccharide lyase n=1 Tax=Leptospira meyeri TaxID=29508 RepID=UPI0010843E7E|nr:polysaccharide lyase [Leptospira meyeri]MCW7489163.1 polysaccharide lyase [Leptospira meyeri]TGM64756.1 polysaccharide lyase [Leptospira meyeri]TGM66778.1 polysaccharide lyase [Leptospira meyeri]
MGTNRNQWHRIFLLGVCLGLTSFQVQCQKNEEDQTTEILAGTVLAYQAATTITCTSEQLTKTQNGRIFQTSFESASEFSSFYIVPSPYQSVATHGQSTEQKRTGTYSHKASILSVGPTCFYPQNCNHRGYPTIQLNKLPSGGFKTPVLVEFYAFLDMNLPNGLDWFSFATFSADPSDQWRRVVLVNIDPKNYAYLMHVPNHNQSQHTFQNTNTSFPQRQWTKITTCLDFSPSGGMAKVWMDGTLISTASVSGGCGVLEQAHFGLYASPTVGSGTIYNDDLRIEEVSVCP